MLLILFYCAYAGLTERLIRTGSCCKHHVCFSFSLRLFQKFDTFRILVCGGDGSVGWVLSEIDALTLHKQVCTVDLITDRCCITTSSQGYSCRIKRCFIAVVSVGSSSSGYRERSSQGSGLGVRLRRRHSAAANSGEAGESQHQDVRQVAGCLCD